MINGTDTKDRILHTATRLMGRHGINQVSIRQVLVEAGVNLALCQYHFGGRDGLVEAVLRRPARALTEAWDTSLSEFEAEGVERVAPQDVLAALFDPVIRLGQEDPEGANLLGQLLTNPDPFFRRLGHSLFHGVLSRFGHCLRVEFSGTLPDKELSARIELLAGFLLFSLSRSGSRIFINESDIAGAWDRASLGEMVSFCLAGLEGPATRSPELIRGLA